MSGLVRGVELEQKFARTFCLDLTALREIDNLVKELQERLVNVGIHVKMYA
jgi:hypothetical protein